MQVLNEVKDNFRKDDDVRWHRAAAEKEQPQVDPQGASRQLRPLMPRPAKTKDSTANLGFEAKLWLAADQLRAGEGCDDGASVGGPDERAVEAGFPGQGFYGTQISDCFWFCGTNSTLDLANHTRLLGGETEFKRVA